VNLRDLRYLLAIAEHRHFGRAAEACHVSQPTLSGQVKKLEDWLQVALFERTNKRVLPTAVGERILEHARAAVAAADAIEAEARSARDPLAGRLRLGVIPTLGPYLLPLILGPLRHAHPRLELEPWEDLTDTLLARLQSARLDAALIATDVPGLELVTMPLFTEPFLAAVPRRHALAGRKQLGEDELAPDLLVLAEGHCLRGQALAACERTAPAADALRAASLETLVNMVAAGYGTTLVPQLAAATMRSRGVAFVPLAGSASRGVRIVSRAGFPRAAAIEAVAAVIRRVAADAIRGALPGDAGGRRRARGAA
jgi:LysR family hydrogen peroxide-inducible transcriptional activator